MVRSKEAKRRAAASACLNSAIAVGADYLAGTDFRTAVVTAIVVWLLTFRADVPSAPL